MLTTTGTFGDRVERDDSCDIRILSGNCEHATSVDMRDKYRCDICESLPGLYHEVKPAALPYVSGDYDNLY